MVFSSMTFLLAFLPALLLIYFAIPKPFRMARNIALFAFSVLFYAWGEPIYVFLILFCVTLTFLASKKIAEKNRNALVFAIVMNLIPLAVFKYIDFIISQLNLISGVNLPPTELPLPIGISFYTFQVLSYVIDLYRERIQRQKNPLNLALYVFLFPQLIAGPIVRYSTVEEQIENRQENWSDFQYGLRRFVVGLAKKVLIANQAGLISTTIMAQDMDTIGSGLVWIAVFAFAIQIYFDFSGYSDMAIGLGRMVGFKFLENFNYPYVSRSVTEFWRRWHISLSSFFRDYVYIPLGGNRVSNRRWLFNIMIVWFLTGLWHGPFWNFAIWGMYFGVLLIIEKKFLQGLLEKLPSVLSWAYAFIAILVGWALFMIETNNPDELFTFLGKMFSFQSADGGYTLRSLQVQDNVPYLIVGFIFSFPILQKIKELSWISNLKSLNGQRLVTVFTEVVIVFLYVSSLIYIIGSSFNPFLYFRF